jgi:hypothetical protein
MQNNMLPKNSFRYDLIAIASVFVFMLAPCCCFDCVAQPPASAASPRQDTEPKFEKLFDGKSLKNWSGDKNFWTVSDGVIVGQTTEEKKLKKNNFLIWQGAPLENFELKLKFKISGEGANSGIQFRSKDLGEFSVSGYQADIDITGRFIGILYEERGRGILAQRGQKVERTAEGKNKVIGKTLDQQEFKKKVDMEKWNEYVVIANGNHIVQKINGLTTVDFTDKQSNKAASKGILALQLHVGRPMKIEFKDIELRRIKDSAND